MNAATPQLETRTSELVSGPLRSTILRLALPAVGTTLFQVLFNITDTFWVGRTLGPTALAGVSTASYALWIIVTTGELIGVGLTAVASRRHGEGHPLAAARAAGTALWLAVALALVVAIVGFLGLDSLFRLMNAPADVAAQGRQYLEVQLFGAFLIYGYFVVDSSFRSAGDTRRPFLLLGSSVLLNLLLDPILILGLGPLPALGVRGAAISSVLTRGVGFIAGSVLLLRAGRIRSGFEPAVARSIVRIGFPVLLTGCLFSSIYILLVPVVRRFGTPALAALGIGHKVEGISYMMSVGFGLAAEAMVGQNLGAGLSARARKVGWTTAFIATIPTTIFAALFTIVPSALAGVFTTDPATVADAALYLRAVGIAQLAVSFEEVLYASLCGAGYTLWPMVWIVGLSALRLPLAPLAAARWGLAGVWGVLGVTMLARGVAVASIWRWGGWEKARA